MSNNLCDNITYICNFMFGGAVIFVDNPTQENLKQKWNLKKKKTFTVLKKTSQFGRINNSYIHIFSF